MQNRQFITGIFHDDKDLLEGIKQIQSNNLTIFDVRTPFPVHGLDEILQLKRSRLPRLGFIAGTLGAILAFAFQAWVFSSSWPINFGGKPFLSVPSFIPVTFEMAVLFAAISLVFGFLIKSGIGPGAPTFIFDERTSDNAFLVVIELMDDPGENRTIEILKASGAEDIKSINPSLPKK